MLSGRISTLKDESGAIFIDRDPKLFATILTYLRSREIDFKGLDIGSLCHEAEFYGLTPLVKRLALCEDLNHSSCGDVLFHGYLPPPPIPVHLPPPTPANRSTGSSAPTSSENAVTASVAPTMTRGNLGTVVVGVATEGASTSRTAVTEAARPGSIVRVSETAVAPPPPPPPPHRGHSRNSSLDFRPTHARTSSDLRAVTLPHVASSATYDAARHARTSSADLNKLVRTDLGVLFTNQGMQWIDPLRVRIVKGHHNWIAVVYAHFVTCYRMKDSSGWQLAFTSPHIEPTIERAALNAKVMTPNQSAESGVKMLAIACGSHIRLWSVTEEAGVRCDVGAFNLHVPVDHLFFIGSQLVALSHTGKVGVWHSMTQHWQIQDVVPIASFDTAGSFLLLGCNNGSIYYIDMQKFPLRMKDNDLLITELYKDSSNDVVTAISVYLTPKTSMCGNWIEIAYGTSSGAVRVIVQHPETVGHGPQLFQTFTVHRSPVTKVMLSEKYLVSLCSEYNHVRAWGVTRFRGMISTQPGSTPISSFKIVSLEDVEPNVSYAAGNDCGPYGEQDDEQVFIQKVIPETDQLYVRFSSTGKRVCVIKSVDGSPISAFCVHECDGSNRMGSRPRRYIFTGHTSGAVQMWDLTTALDLANKGEQASTQANGGGPSALEVFRLLEQCDLSNSRCSTPSISPSPSLVQYAVAKLKAANMAFLSRQPDGQLGGGFMCNGSGINGGNASSDDGNVAGGAANLTDDMRITRC